MDLVIVLATYAGVAVGRWPWVRMNRATIALVGAAALLGTGALSLDQAFAALDGHTLLLLFSMMVLNANLRLAGFFGWVTAATLKAARGARALLGLLLATSGVLSALFLNDTLCLMLTPLVLEVTRRLKRDPVPYLVGLATSANIGSVATITGNPQNMLIAMSGGIDYLTFAAHLAPIALLGLALAWGVLVLAFPHEFRGAPLPPAKPTRVRIYRPLLYKSLGATAAMLVMFLAGVPVAEAAFLATAALLFTRRLKPDRVFADFDWQLLVFFSALFVVTAALPTPDVTLPGTTASLMGLTAVLSNLVSNVPAVLLLRPLLQDQHAWLVVAAASTLAGNLTLLGSVANLIVAESARRQGVHLSFGAYLKAGLPITLLTLLLAWLLL